jgi:hypothetical protein
MLHLPTFGRANSTVFTVRGGEHGTRPCRWIRVRSRSDSILRENCSERTTSTPWWTTPRYSPVLRVSSLIFEASTRGLIVYILIQVLGIRLGIH